MKNFKTLKNNIPSKVKTAPRKSFEVLWSAGICDTQSNKVFGRTEFEPNRIILNTEQSDKEAVLTTWHEFIHALDHDHDISLTEAQVLKLEKCFQYVRELVLTLEGKK